MKTLTCFNWNVCAGMLFKQPYTYSYILVNCTVNHYWTTRRRNQVDARCWRMSGFSCADMQLLISHISDTKIDISGFLMFTVH